ncbi:MAG TPA: ATP-dependent metallopeptidase FtsH/Yme1/Tma family protein, partial [Aggregatilineales bacterium]|nr:ATP-dependent metallopeptidase FtsH/Yme1/Tma family protein [Aggregatilineales bacterium]
MNKPTPTPVNNQNFKVGALIGLTVLAAILLFYVILPAFGGSGDTLSINKLADDVQAGKVKSITVQNDTDLVVIMNDGTFAHATKESSEDLPKLLSELGVDPAHLKSFDYHADQGNSGALILNLVITLGPMLIIGW